MYYNNDGGSLGKHSANSYDNKVGIFKPALFANTALRITRKVRINISLKSKIQS